MTFSRAVSALLLAVSSPLFAAVELSPVRTPVVSSGEGVGIASNGSGFFAIVETAASVTRISRGVALRPDGTVALGNQVIPDRTSSIARLGDHYVIASADAVSTRLTELAPDGTALRTLFTLPTSLHFPIHATTNGEHVLIPTVFTGLIVDRSGAFREVDYGQQARIAGADDDEFFVTLPNRTLFRRVRIDGTVTTVDLGGGVFDAAVAASDNTNVLVVTDDASGMRSVVVTPSGGIEAQLIGPRNRALRPVSLTWTGREYVLTAFAPNLDGLPGSDVVALRISSDGSAIGDTVSVFRGVQMVFDGAAFNGERINVAVTASTQSPAQAFSISFRAADLANVTTNVISFDIPAQVQAKVASSGQTSLVAWREQAANGMILKAAVLGPGGRISPKDLEIATGLSSFRDHAVVYANGSYTLLWGENTTLRARRIGEDSQFIDAEPITIASDPAGLGGFVSASTDGKRVLAAFDVSEGRTIRAAVIDGTSVVSTQSLAGTTRVEAIDTAFDGSRYLVVWRRPQYDVIFPGSVSPIHIVAAFFDRDGAAGHEIILTQAVGARDLSAAARPGAFLVTFMDATQTQQSGVVSGTSTPVLGPLFGGPMAHFSKLQWTGSEFLSTAIIGSQVLLLRRDADGKLLEAKPTLLPGAGIPDPPLLAGKLAIVPQKVFSPGEVAATRLVVYRDYEIFPPTRRRIAR